MSKLKTYLLEDAVEKLIDYRGKTPVKTENGIPLITAKVIKNGRIEAPNEFIAEEEYESWMTRGIPEIGDVVLTTEAPLGEVAQIKTKEKIALAQRVITLRGKRNLIDSTYLKYFLFSPIGQGNLKAKETGSTVTGIKQSELRKVEIYAPDYKEQVEIASILSSLDDKIDLNLQINQTLEAMAQAIFKEWFVNFNFPGCDGALVRDLPKGWDRQSIESIASKIQYGFTQSSTLEPKGPKFLRITDIQGGSINWNEVPFCEVTESDLEKYRIKEHDIFIARTGASTGENVYVIDPPLAVFASYLIRVQFESPCLACFVGTFLRTEEYFNYISSIKGGSAQPNANARQLTGIEITVPDAGTLEKYFVIVNSFNKRISLNNQENETLIQIRDSLLPKLMSGKIEVKANA